LRLLLGVWLAVAAALVTAVMVVMGAAALSITTAAITFPGVTLAGSDQTVDGSTSAWRASAEGESGGWNVTVSSTDFSNGGSHSIAVSNFEIRLLDANIVRVSGDTSGPVSTQTTYAAVSGTPLKIASAAVGDGDGVYDLTPDFQLTVPAESYSGSYTATVTIDIVTGP
jgi:hypothetical protein